MIGRRKSGLGLPLALAIMCAGLAWVLYHDLEASVPWLERIDPPAGNALSIPPLPEEADFVMAPSQAFQEVLERPIFTPGRRPPVELALAPEQPLGLALKGTVLSDQGRFALLVVSEGGALQRLKIGDQVNGWTLVAIQPDRVTFRRQGAERQLSMSFDRPPAVPNPKRPRRRRPADGRGEAGENPPEGAAPAVEAPTQRQ